MEAYKKESEIESMNNESRIVRVETVIENIHYMLERIDKRFDKLDEKINSEFFNTELLIKDNFNKLDNKIDYVETHLISKIDVSIARLETKVDTNFKWLMGMMITLFVLNGFVPIISKIIMGMFGL